MVRSDQKIIDDVLRHKIVSTSRMILILKFYSKNWGVTVALIEVVFCLFVLFARYEKYLFFFCFVLPKLGWYIAESFCLLFHNSETTLKLALLFVTLQKLELFIWAHCFSQLFGIYELISISTGYLKWSIRSSRQGGRGNSVPFIVFPANFCYWIGLWKCDYLLRNEDTFWRLMYYNVSWIFKFTMLISEFFCTAQ